MKLEYPKLPCINKKNLAYMVLICANYSNYSFKKDRYDRLSE
jgi:hypothetical protein